jgi:hypothetical protein
MTFGSQAERRPSTIAIAEDSYTFVLSSQSFYARQKFWPADFFGVVFMKVFEVDFTELSPIISEGITSPSKLRLLSEAIFETLYS